MESFKQLTNGECEIINGGGIILAGCAIAGGCVAVFGAAFAVGYGLAQWLG